MWSLLACFGDTTLTKEPVEEPATEGTPAWQPGDPIPGWDDYPCEAELEPFASSVRIEFELLYDFKSEPACRYTDTDYDWCESAERPADTSFRLCGEEDVSLCTTPSADGEKVYIQFGGDRYVERGSRGQGLYDFTTLGPQRFGTAQLTSNVYGNVATYDNIGYTGTGYDPLPPDGVGCLSRVRPDEMTGLAVIDLRRLGDDYAGIPLEDYPEAYILPFSIRLPDHGGYYTCSGVDLPDDVSERHYTYSPVTDYDTFWPWDEITDPDVRQQVYDRYTPYGWEERGTGNCK